VAHPQIHTTMPTTEVKDRKALIRVGIASNEKEISHGGVSWQAR
jgi:capsid protein